MKTSKRLLNLMVASTLLINCGKDDAPEPKVENKAPKAFSATASVSGNSAEINWTAATDPDGDTVKYDVQLGTETVLSNGTVTSFTADNLEYNNSYSGKVIASDPDGLTSESSFEFTTEDMPNSAPEAIVLSSPENNAIVPYTMPTISWEAATDPDGDPISYDLYLDSNADPTSLVETDLSNNTFTLPGALKSNTTYYWKVKAKDDKGGETISEIRSFSTQVIIGVTEINSNAAFPKRYGHTNVVFQGKMWIIGGTDAGTYYNDIWTSEDGENWTEVSPIGTTFGARSHHASVVYDNKIWVIAGRPNISSEFNDVWYSEDGISWTEATGSADFEERYSHEMTFYDNKMWLFGGRDHNSPSAFTSKDVWSSVDGINWTKVSDNVGFSFRTGAKVVVFENKMWRIGGQDDGNEVYTSTNGADWTLITESAEFGNRQNHTAVVFDDKIWVMGGALTANLADEFSDVWYSKDGITWAQPTNEVGYGDRVSATSVVFDDKIWIIAGEAGFGTTAKNDVWRLNFNEN